MKLLNERDMVAIWNSPNYPRIQELCLQTLKYCSYGKGLCLFCTYFYTEAVAIAPGQDTPSQHTRGFRKQTSLESSKYAQAVPPVNTIMLTPTATMRDLEHRPNSLRWRRFPPMGQSVSPSCTENRSTSLSFFQSCSVRHATIMIYSSPETDFIRYKILIVQHLHLALNIFSHNHSAKFISIFCH